MTVKDVPADRFWIHAGRLSPIPWFDLGVLYAVLLAVAAVDLAIVVTRGFEIVSGPLWNDLAFALLFLVVGAIYAATGRSSSIASLLFVVASLVMAGPVGLALDFTTKAMGNPFADADLAGWDRSLGLDWVAYERWFSSHPILSLTSGVAYSGSTLVLFLALIVLGVLGHLRRMVRLAVAASLTASVCIAIGGFLPAVGPHRFYDIADGGKAYWVDTIIRVVTQQPHLIVLNGQPPLTTFPSFHTAVAVLATIGCWQVRRFGVIFALFNLYWALAIPVWGSHYFTDMLVGAVIAVVVYWASILILLPGGRWEA